MTVQRQYTLPNCSLMVEGLSGGDDIDPMAPLTVVLNTEFTFPGITDTLSGGREFLDALAKTVSSYAQSLLSGIAYPMTEEMSESHPVVLKPGEDQRHQLIANVSDSTGGAVRKTLMLSTVQIFDLMEAVDQLLADTQTLPDMTLQLASLHRRHVRPAEPVAKRVVPPAVGFSALAASAALLFMVPVPEVETRIEESETSALVEDGTTEAGTPGTESTPAPPPGADSDEPATDAESATPTEATNDDNEPALATAPVSSAAAITDPDEIARLEAQLEDTLGGELPETIPFEESLVYRVTVSESGDLLGYKYENDAAIDNVDDTPLPELTFVPVDPEQSLEEPVAQFRVTFEPDGEVTVEPFETDTE
ncbi:MAG: DUF4335 domain-containing protein [Cyanobacteria bacterium P01_F01_bin.86]